MRCPTLGIHGVTGKGFRAWMPLSRPVEPAGSQWSCREQGADARVLGFLGGALTKKERTEKRDEGLLESAACARFSRAIKRLSSRQGADVRSPGSYRA